MVEPPEMTDLVDTDKIVQKYLPKQTDIDNILKVIQRKVLKGTHLPVTMKEIQAGYLKSLYLFRNGNNLEQEKAVLAIPEVCVD